MRSGLSHPSLTGQRGHVRAAPTPPRLLLRPPCSFCPTLRPARLAPPLPQPPRAMSVSELSPLGVDFLTFLAATVAIVPTCKQFKVSPVLGFMASGFALNQAGLVTAHEDVERLSELGVLFLLFEMGLELSFDRLQSLAKYAFGMGGLQITITGAAFFAALTALPAADPGPTAALLSARSPNEAAVIAAALSLSSSAFVLQLLAERGEGATRFGGATLGVLLMQDIAVIPFLVLLPLLGEGLLGGGPSSLVQALGPAALTTAAALGALLFCGHFVLQRAFELVAESRSSEAFVALCLLTVVGSSSLTASLGLSETLGAFLAGALLSETTYRPQVEADIRPFKGLLLGLFFASVGASLDATVLRDNATAAAALLAGLVGAKAAINVALGPLFGLTRSESIKAGFLLAQGGEFAFVLLQAAESLHLLPHEQAALLMAVTALSMALTPALAAAGDALAATLDARWPPQRPQLPAVASGGMPPGAGVGERPIVGAVGGAGGVMGGRSSLSAAAGTDDLVEILHPGELPPEPPVLILGFGPAAQVVANLLASQLWLGNNGHPPPFLALDRDAARAAAARAAGFPVAYGDAARAATVLAAAGCRAPAAVVVAHSKPARRRAAVEAAAAAFPGVAIYSTASGFREAAELQAAGARRVVMMGSEAGLNLGERLLRDLTGPSDAQRLRYDIGRALEVQTQSLRRISTGGRRVTPPGRGQPEIFVLDPAAMGSNGSTSSCNSSGGGGVGSPGAAGGSSACSSTGSSSGGGSGGGSRGGSSGALRQRRGGPRRRAAAAAVSGNGGGMRGEQQAPNEAEIQQQEGKNGTANEGGKGNGSPAVQQQPRVAEVRHRQR